MVEIYKTYLPYYNNDSKTSLYEDYGTPLFILRSKVTQKAEIAYTREKISELRAIYPFLPIVFFIEPSIYPKNLAERSEIEKYMAANQSGHYNRWFDALKKPNATIPKTYEEFGYSIDNLIEMLDGSRTIIENNQAKLKEYSGSYVNVFNGHRVVPNQPDATKTVYTFGGCITFGAGCPDDKTWPAYLQQLFNDAKNVDFRVENYGAFISGREKYMLNKMMAIPYIPGDIVIYGFARLKTISALFEQNGCFFVDMTDLFERPHNWGDNVFLDTCHPNENGQFAIAKTIFSFVQSFNYYSDFIKAPTHTHTHGARSAFASCPPQFVEELEEYKSSLVSLRPRIGSIVMNCNPFTLGHRYLIEQSSAKVEKLFVFVVEEDRSFFSFEDRIRLVKEGTSDLKNVVVIPSGKFIISSITFDDYFGKDAKQEETNIDASCDVEIFAQHIAPTLGITVRFAGEEPLDKVTLQYNKTLAHILPRYGIEFEVIPRKESDGRPISASRVRKLLEERNFAEIEKIVPVTTYQYLTKMSL